ncbi:UNVERIFIED_CONTAM: hypothetical protein GTU68_057969 [Idotea baltica]|nr:hypothetical protein [Idotea baltica]
MYTCARCTRCVNLKRRVGYNY